MISNSDGRAVRPSHFTDVPAMLELEMGSVLGDLRSLCDDLHALPAAQRVSLLEKACAGWETIVSEVVVSAAADAIEDGTPLGERPAVRRALQTALGLA